MFKSKYSTVLTVFLIILIITIIVAITILGINTYKNYEDEKARKRVFAELQEPENNENNKTVENTINTVNNENAIIQPIVDFNTTQNESTSQSGATRPKTKFYKNYAMVGYIKIEKTKVEYPILLDISPAALEVAVGVMYPSNPKINQPGLTVIIGHNYRNGKFFSNNKNLAVGDKIQITDLESKTLSYTIYEISTIPDTDTEYISRERGNNTEIALSTCTDDGKSRLVILARAE